MKRHGWATGALVLALVTAFAAVEAAGVAVLTEPEPASRGGTAAALVGVGLLVGDVVLRAPSSLVMPAHGTVFVAVLALAATFWLVSTQRDDAPRLGRV